jgi:hypothetical protein
MHIGRWVGWAFLGAPLAVGCGGGSPSKPTAIATPPPAVTAVLEGTVWQAVSGETGGPVAGARFVLPAATYTADDAGQIKLTQPATYGSDLTIQASGYLDRQTRVRRDGAPVFTLWPRTAAGWPSEEYLKTLVYTDTAEGSPLGVSPLRRLKRGETHAAVLLPQKLFDTHHIWEEFDYGTGMINTAVGGRVVYTLATTRPSSGLVFEVAVADGTDTTCQRGYLAYTRLTMQSNEITGGSIVFCDASYTGWSGVSAHELGHTFGLRHSMHISSIMGAYTRFTRLPREFSAGEERSFRMLLDRPAGNRWPDDDRQVSALGSHVETILCPLP